MPSQYRRWSEHPYPNESTPPRGHSEPSFWPMFFIYRGANHQFLDVLKQPIKWTIKQPNQIDWDHELFIVKQTLLSLTAEQRKSAEYWATGELTAKISSLLYELAEKYQLGTPSCARMLGYYHAAINDTCVMSWYFKYLWDVARPIQFDQSLATVVFTPRFPAYPSAHATIAGCSEVLLGYFFPSESVRLSALMKESAQSRLYAGVHFKTDNDEGLRLGRQIGEMVVKIMQLQNVRPF